MADKVHDLSKGEALVLVTCNGCYCAVVERFWDQHVRVCPLREARS